MGQTANEAVVTAVVADLSDVASVMVVSVTMSEVGTVVEIGECV